MAIATKDECDKLIERDKHKKSVKILTFNYDQALKEVKMKKAKIIKLKGRRAFKFDKWLEDEIAPEEKDRKHSCEIRRETNGCECGSISCCCLQCVIERELNVA